MTGYPRARDLGGCDSQEGNKKDNEDVGEMHFTGDFSISFLLF